ncbi:ABC transporter permease [Acidicapsa ligni]|uniref:ABC transporter permease n=1 Tax=Acidicapsa ligni TaxID=542300 RepID=UPI0021E03E10|nr:ABC transporter permease [Acidicapsa ligni]
MREVRRSFRRSPILTMLAGLILALGFAGSTLAFTVMAAMSRTGSNGLLPLSFETLAEETVGGASRSLPWPAYEYLSSHISVPGVAIAAYGGPVRARLLAHGQGREISVSGVSSSFFPGFTRGGVFAGSFAPGWDNGSGEPEVVLAESLAKQLFGSVHSALGQDATLNGGQYRVIGVAPRSFTGLWAETDAWVAPEKMIALGNGSRAAASNTRSQSASAERISWKMEPIFFVLTASSTPTVQGNRIALERFAHAPENRRFHLHLSDGLTNDPVRDAKLRSWSHLTFIVAVTLIVAAGLNYAGLLLAQAPRQAEEIRLKRILGARTLRLIAEGMCGPAFTVLASFLLAAAGTILSLIFFGKQAAVLLPAGSISWPNVTHTLAVELAAVCLLAAAIALLPALRLLREGGAPRLGYTSTGDKWTGIAMRSMVAVQMASCIVMCLLAAPWSRQFAACRKRRLALNRLT